MAVAHFFIAVYTDIFKRLFIARVTYNSLFRFVLTYFGTVETNDHGMLHLYYLVWLCNVYHLTNLHNQLQSDIIYIIKMVKFIDNIICYLIVDITLCKNIKSETISANLDNTNEDFAL